MKKADHADAEQSKAFIQKARELGADRATKGGDKLMGKLARMKPEPRTKKRSK